MSFGTLCVGGFRVFFLSLACHAAFADWAQSSQPLAVKPSPDGGQLVVQNPPGFSWSRHSSLPAAYDVEITGDVSGVETVHVKRNWYLPARAFKPGRYSWRVRPAGSSDWSAIRSFEVPTGAVVFEVPDTAQLKTRVLGRAHPRSLSVEPLGLESWVSKVRVERGAALERLRTEVSNQSTALPTITDADWPLLTSGVIDSAKAAQMGKVRHGVGAVSRQLEAAALLYRLTQENKYLREALLRGDQLAALSPDGPTSYANQDQGARQIALSLIKAVDLLWADLDKGVRQHWLSVVERRTSDIYRDLARNQSGMEQNPLDSHGGTNLGYLALISALGLGEFPQAEKWFDFSMRFYAHHVFPWSGPEGGFANGTAYAQHSSDYALKLWQPLASATGVNLFTKPWAIGLLQFFTHFLPPGSPTHAFGDEAELQPDTRHLKAYASRFSSPQAAWYVKNLLGEENALTLLQAPLPLPVELAKAATPPENAAFYRSIGWVAMHSSSSDRGRTAIFFKSSPYGSYNHSHGDQNSFTLMRGGRPLLIDSGWYDYYGSPLWKSWYRQTRAHNAITFDGGKGQTVDGDSTESLKANGNITAFSTTPTLDFVEGDATRAYGGALTTAVRRIWHLRNKDAALVWDKIESPVARVFEWNMHATVPLTADAEGRVTIRNQEQSLCITPLLRDGIQFQKRSGVPSKPGVVEDHAFFATQIANKSAEFLVLLDIGCKQPKVTMKHTPAGREVSVGGVLLTIANLKPVTTSSPPK